MYVHRSRDGLIAWISARARRMAGGDASASRDALARAVAAAKAASRPRLASVFAKSSDPRYAPRPEANYGERWEAQEALATVAGAGPAAAKLGLEHPEHETRDGAACGETRMGDASTSGRPNDSNEAPVDGNRPGVGRDRGWGHGRPVLLQPVRRARRRGKRPSRTRVS
jgi:hypothetical protein